MLQLVYPKLTAGLGLGYRLFLGLKNKPLILHNQTLKIFFSSLTP
jgi:hypothetical protein